MKLELLFKVIDKQPTLEEAQEIDIKKIIDGDDVVSFTYNPHVIDVRDVGIYGREDAEHTKIMTPFGLFHAKVEYSLFKSIYESMTHNFSKTINDFRAVKR